jgi:hypothetical protein
LGTMRAKRPPPTATAEAAVATIHRDDRQGDRS